jgi:hypothetical protein
LDVAPVWVLAINAHVLNETAVAVSFPTPRNLEWFAPAIGTPATNDILKLLFRQFETDGALSCAASVPHIEIVEGRFGLLLPPLHLAFHL